MVGEFEGQQWSYLFPPLLECFGLIQRSRACSHCSCGRLPLFSVYNSFYFFVPLGCFFPGSQVALVLYLPTGPGPSESSKHKPIQLPISNQCNVCYICTEAPYSTCFERSRHLGKEGLQLSRADGWRAYPFRVERSWSLHSCRSTVADTGMASHEVRILRAHRREESCSSESERIGARNPNSQ